MKEGIVLAVILGIALLVFNGFVTKARKKKAAERKVLTQNTKEAMNIEALLNCRSMVPLSKHLQVLLCDAIERHCTIIKRIDKNNDDVGYLIASVNNCREMMSLEPLNGDDKMQLLDCKIPASAENRKLFMNIIRELRNFIKREAKRPFCDAFALKREMDNVVFLQHKAMIEVYIERAEGACLSRNIAYAYELIEEIKMLLSHAVFSEIPGYIEMVSHKIDRLISIIKQGSVEKVVRATKDNKQTKESDGLEHVVNVNKKQRWAN